MSYIETSQATQAHLGLYWPQRSSSEQRDQTEPHRDTLTAASNPNLIRQTCSDLHTEGAAASSLDMLMKAVLRMSEAFNVCCLITHSHPTLGQQPPNAVDIMLVIITRLQGEQCSASVGPDCSPSVQYLCTQCAACCGSLCWPKAQGRPEE